MDRVHCTSAPLHTLYSYAAAVSRLLDSQVHYHLDANCTPSVRQTHLSVLRLLDRSCGRAAVYGYLWTRIVATKAADVRHVSSFLRHHTCIFLTLRIISFLLPIFYAEVSLFYLLLLLFLTSYKHIYVYI